MSLYTSHGAPVTSATEVTGALVRDLVDIDPSLSARFGWHDTDPGRLPDLGPSAASRAAGAYRRALRRIESRETDGPCSDPADDLERRMLQVQGQAEAALLEHGDLSIALVAPNAPLGRLRMLLRPWRANSNQDTIDARVRQLAGVPRAIADYRETLASAVAQGHVAGPVQTREAVRSWTLMFGEEGSLARASPPATPESVLKRARVALAEMVQWVDRDYRLHAQRDAVGMERYVRAWQRRTGSVPDLRGAYAWALERHRDLVERQRVVARHLDSTLEPAELIRHLSVGLRSDLGNQRLTGSRAVLDYLDVVHARALQYTQTTVAPLHPRLRSITSRIGSPDGGASAYYERPGADGQPATTVLPYREDLTWASWTLRSLWHHEGGPGHHVQLGGWALAADRIGTYRSSIGSVEAVTEGWAMYAETLADQRGEFERVDRLGYLDGQLLRAARVVVDIGLHVGAELGLRVPDGPFAGQPWSPDAAAEMLGRNRDGDDVALRREVVRYLASPAQAVCYALGEESWWQLRAQAQHQADFNEREWHQQMLNHGSATFDSLALAGHQ